MTRSIPYVLAAALAASGIPVALHAERTLEAPQRLLVLHRALAGDGRGAPAGVAVLALDAPGAGLEEEGVLYRCTCF